MSSIKLVKGSCADQEVDAIVNAANRNLWSGAGICGAIYKKAGYEELNAECSKISTPLHDGDAIITSSCKINNCKKIIHAVGPDFGHKPGAFEELYKAYYNSLNVLRNNELHSISFPLISSGIFGYGLKNPVLESVKKCLRAYSDFVRKNKDYEIEVLLCAYTDSEFDEAMKEFDFKEYIDNSEFEPTELTNDLIDTINYDDIIAVTISEGGAMGEPNCFYAVDNKYNLYHVNFGYDSIDFNKLQNKFTILKQFSCFFEEVNKLEKKWAWFNMGFGNYLMVRENLEKIVRKFIDEYLGMEYEHGELYQRWFFILKYINEKNYK
jgi:O-acetyl-ADP-ribose deacetylase (regulator of RNase III)